MVRTSYSDGVPYFLVPSSWCLALPKSDTGICENHCRGVTPGLIYREPLCSPQFRHMRFVEVGGSDFVHPSFVLRRACFVLRRAYFVLRRACFVLRWACISVGMLFGGNVFRWECFPARMLSGGNAFRWGCFTVDVLLCGDAFQWKCFSVRMFFGGHAFQWECFSVGMLSGANTFQGECFAVGMLFGGNAFVWECFSVGMLFGGHAFLHIRGNIGTCPTLSLKCVFCSLCCEIYPSPSKLFVRVGSLATGI